MESIYKILFFLVSNSTEWEDNWDILIEENLCQDISVLTLLVAFSICFIFYIVIGRMTTTFQKTFHWALFALLSGCGGFVVAFLNVRKNIYPGIIVENFGYMFALSNVIWPILYFVIFSLGLKYFSLYARRTPFNKI